MTMLNEEKCKNPDRVLFIAPKKKFSKIKGFSPLDVSKIEKWWEEKWQESEQA